MSINLTKDCFPSCWGQSVFIQSKITSNHMWFECR